METEKKYNESLSFLFSQLPMFSRMGAPAYKPGLETSLRLDEYFGHPHHNFKSIHIGGTNGKGSTSHMIASVLQSQGYKTGLYTSPHLVDFRERMRINGKMIPKKYVIEFVEKWKNSEYAGKPSFFELTMMMAFDWFAKENVDFAVIEVGMGGRLDSTNIITPILSVITNISHDHNQFLGNTLEEIAGEKAGIIKHGIPVIIGEKDPDTYQVFEIKAEKEGAPIRFAEERGTVSNISGDWKGYWNCETRYGPIHLPLGGEYQKKNIQTVLSALEVLKEIDIEITPEAIRSGIEKVTEQTGLLGRWTILADEPLTIADTGHNIGGLSYNFSQLKELMKEKRNGKLRVIIGFVADKAIDNILKILPTETEYYVTNAQIPRALSAHDLFIKMKESGFKAVHEFTNVKEAYTAAQKEASTSDIIYIGGSTFIVADFLS